MTKVKPDHPHQDLNSGKPGDVVNEKLARKQEDAVGQELSLSRLANIIRDQAHLIEQLTYEFRKQLSIVQSTCHELSSMEGLDLPRPIKKLLDNSRRQTQALNSILNFTRNLVGNESGDLPLMAQSTNLYDLLNEIVTFTEVKGREKGIRINLEQENREVRAFLDKSKLTPCIISMLSSVIDHSPSDSRIDIHFKVERKTHDAGPRQFATVEITGEHYKIPVKIHSQLFNTFSAYKSADGMAYESLLIPRYIMNLHGGELKLENRTPGRTTIICRIPLGRDHLIDSEINLDAAVREEGSELSTTAVISTESFSIGTGRIKADKPTILLVDDEFEVLMLLKVLLAKQYNIVVANNGRVALKLVKDQKPDLIISDIMMPGMDGISFTRLVKGDKELNSIPIILLTGVAAEKVRIEGLKTRADAYLTKPFNSEELRVTVQNLIEKHHRLAYRYAVNLEAQQPDTVHLKSQDKKFLEQVHKTVINHLSDSNFTPNDLAQAVFISKRQLERRIKILTRLSPKKFILDMCLSTARELLIHQATSTVSETATAVGFTDPAYFSRLFNQRFGKSPYKIIGRLDKQKDSRETDESEN